VPGVFSDAAAVWNVVAFDGQLFAVGLRDTPDGSSPVAFWRSADGITWAPLARDEATFADAQEASLVATSSGLVAWGTAGGGTCSGQGEGQVICTRMPVLVWTSPDGEHWTRIADASMFEGASVSTITDGPAGLVAVGDTGWDRPAIWVSADGTRWRRLSLPAAVFAGAHFSSVRATASGYVLAGGTGTQRVSVTGGEPSNQTVEPAGWWSPDGRTWTKAIVERVGEHGSNLGSISVGADGLVAVGYGSGGHEGVAWTSADGRAWQPIAPGYFGAPPAAPGVPTLPSFTISDDGTHLVAVGVAEGLALRMWTSSDGVTWRPLSFSGATDAIPLWPGDPMQPMFDRAFVVPDGLVITATPGRSAQIPVWQVIAPR
jgi:hypothetical protein